MQGSASVTIDGPPQAGLRVWGLVRGYTHIGMISKPESSKASPVLR